MGWIDWISGENNLNFEKGAECRVNESYEKSKQLLAFSKKQVEKAGRMIRKNEGDFEHAITVVQNFRAAH
ncbi:MAG: hypothetical protein JKX90_04260 [Colwellia sp.]|nr:hypothetical protein [Colwellia sp.]